ncbi:membrane protein [Actinomycetospora sp. NBRC 106375]|uniref:YdcF family protein n=1 Tax=Actinomycetospora sp. NBRC 106375 TaxID=3032207 RepID=UPI0024A54254|nr:YdcF family protein [Actinomycetospora sp. NBRC 106375]GLZ47126.1 membrane protein [Actinomycetospora sp. NBRC 106375]
MSGPTTPAGPRPAPDPPSTARAALRWAPRVVVGALVIAVLLVGGTAIRVWQLGRVDERQPVDMIVVLGAAQYDGRPSPVFRARLQHALELYEQGVAPRIVTVGGAAPGDAFTEAQAGEQWLVENGVPGQALLPVDDGRDTYESFEAVANVAEQRGWESAALVSDPWHSLRSRTMADDVGLDATTSPTKRGPVVQTRETQFRYIVRETGALIYYHLTHGSTDFSDTGVG